jgi:hypothetical protein
MAKAMTRKDGGERQSEKAMSARVATRSSPTGVAAYSTAADE